MGNSIAGRVAAIGRSGVVAAALLASLLAATAARAELQPETIDVLTLPPGTPDRLYVMDMTFEHMVDSRVAIIEGENLRYVGTVAPVALQAVSPDRTEFYSVATYYTRLNRGDRTDQVDVYDARTLALLAEIPVPAKRAQAIPYQELLRTTADGRFLLLQNATPATSVSVVDLKARKFVAEIPTPGCWGVLPARNPLRFATVCGDGALMTVTLDAAGNEAGRERSASFFDADNDPIFIQSARSGDTLYLFSFAGRVFEANIEGDKPKLGKSWALAPDAEGAKRWRPGGLQPFVAHEPTGTLYVAMHSGGANGTHKNPAEEIWAVDLASRKLRGRVAADGVVLSINVTRDAAPRLYALDITKGGILQYATAPALKFVRRGDGFGRTLMTLETQ
jgi:methylamine dehydrogenase heavy chain